MRIIAAIVIFLLLASLPGAHAQTDYFPGEPKVFNGGLILGANFTQVDGDSFYGYHKVGLNAGGVVYIHFTRTLGVSMELLYSQKGSRGELVTGSQSIGTYVEKYFMNLNYVEVPITFHLIVHNFDLEAGASYAYLISSGEWIEADQPAVIDPVQNRFNTTDFEYIIGAGRRLYKKLYANIRFQYSILSVRPNDRIPYGYSYGNNGQYNNLLNLRFIYFF